MYNLHNLEVIKRNIFLIDGLGALLSSFFLGILLPSFQSWIGMPLSTLYLLALIALGFALYSMSCHFVFKPEKSFWLKLIAGANLSYCLLTIALVIHFWSQITIVGFLYFLGESIIVIVLVWIELQVASQ